MRRRLLALVLLGFAMSAVAEPPKGYKLVWSDEFNGDKLDESKWGFHGLGRRRDAINVKEAVRLDGRGNLVITTSKVEVDGKAQYHTAIIDTRRKFEHTFGYWEARVQLQKQEGHWSAFWLMPAGKFGDPVGDPARGGVEVDVMEYHSRWIDKAQHTLHWDGYGKDHKSTHADSVTKGLHDGFHTFGVLWTKEKYVFFVDERQVWETGKAVSHSPEYALLSLEVGRWAGDIAKAIVPDSILVDYVRVYDPVEPAGK